MKIPRNAPCPCGSGKKCKKCCLSEGGFQEDFFLNEFFLDDDCFDFFDFLYEGEEVDRNTLDEISSRYQDSIRNSPIWLKMVEKFGDEQAEFLLKQCRAEML